MASSAPTPQPEINDAPEKRIRRGCLTIVFLLILVVGFNFLQYGGNIIVLVGGVALLIALIAMALIWRG